MLGPYQNFVGDFAMHCFGALSQSFSPFPRCLQQSSHEPNENDPQSIQGTPLCKEGHLMASFLVLSCRHAEWPMGAQ